MATAAFHSFDSFVTKLASGVFVNALLADTDVLKVYLTNVAPDAATMTEKADLAEMTAEHGYDAGGVDAQNAALNDAGVITVVGSDFLISVVGGTVGPFRYMVLYDSTVAGEPLIGWWDYGNEVTLRALETFEMNFGASLFTVRT